MTHSQMRSPLNRLPELVDVGDAVGDAEVAAGVGVVGTAVGVVGRAVGVVGSAVGVGADGVSDGCAAAARTGAALGRGLVAGWPGGPGLVATLRPAHGLATVPLATSAHAIVRHPAARMAPASSTVFPRRRILALPVVRPDGIR
jgi:hypothetical protein